VRLFREQRRGDATVLEVRELAGVNGQSVVRHMKKKGSNGASNPQEAQRSGVDGCLAHSRAV
jgi:hypothetical protein